MLTILLDVRRIRIWIRASRFKTTKTKQNVCFGCFASIPKQRILVFRLNRNKQKSNPNSLIESIFCYFFRKFRIVSVCFSLFRNSLFRLFCFYTETESFNVSIEPKKPEDQQKQLDREHILVFF